MVYVPNRWGDPVSIGKKVCSEIKGISLSYTKDKNPVDYGKFAEQRAKTYMCMTPSAGGLISVFHILYNCSVHMRYLCPVTLNMVG